MSTELHWQRLSSEMSAISEQAFCAGWMDGLEYRLWEILQGGPRTYGQIVLADDQISRLRDLSDVLGGWVLFNDESEVEEFIDHERWRRLYDAWVQQKSESKKGP